MGVFIFHRDLLHLLLIVCILNQQLVAKDCKTTQKQSNPDTVEEAPTVDE